MGSEGCCLIGTQIPTHKRASYMERVLDKGGGLDIHKKSVKAAIESEDGSIIEAEFGMTFLQLYILKKWLLVSTFSVSTPVRVDSLTFSQWLAAFPVHFLTVTGQTLTTSAILFTLRPLVERSSASVIFSGLVRRP